MADLTLEEKNKILEQENITRDFTIEGMEARMERIGEDETASERMILEGYASVYNDQYKIGSWYIEEIQAGAFNEADLSNVVLNLNHDDSILLGRTKNGSLSLTIDATGLKFRAELPDTQQAKDVYELVRSGLIDQCSFRFSIQEGKSEIKNGDDIFVITKVRKVYDVSVVTFPAYEKTSVQARNKESNIGPAEKIRAVEVADALIKSYQKK